MTKVVGLAEAATVAAACAAVVDHLVAAELPMPSIYLQRGGRLRCHAVRGYWQVFDGMPASAGIIGATFRSGRPVEVHGVGSSPDYLAAAPGVVDELCVPIVVAGVTAGVLNVESVTGLRPWAMTTTVAAAAALADRLAVIGIPVESGAQRLARHGALLADAQEPGNLWSAGCVAACEITQRSAAAIVLADADGQHRVVWAQGAIASRLLDTSTYPALNAIAAWVASGSSCWTLDDPDGYGFPGSGTLRAAGAAAALVVPLVGSRPGAADRGYLLVTDEKSRQPATDEVELVELLGLQIASCARTLASVAALRRQATRDPLTNLGHHAAYQQALTTALSRRGLRGKTAAVMIDVDNFKSVNDRHGHPAGDAILIAVARVLSTVLRDGEELYRVGGDEFATILHVDSAAEARAVAHRLREAAVHGLPTTISIGVALAAPGEQPAALTARADNALYHVKRTGRNGIHHAPTTSSNA